MQSGDGKRHVRIHYWCDHGTQTIDYTLAQSSLASAFPSATIILTAIPLQKGNTREQALILKQFMRSFPADTIHICHLTTLSSEPPRYVIAHKFQQFFLGPASGFLHLAFEDNDLPFYIVPNDGSNQWDTLNAIYIPAVLRLLDHSNQNLSEIFRLKEIAHKQMWVQPIIKGNTMRIVCLYIDGYGNCYFNINKAEFELLRNERKVRILTQMATIEGIMNDYNDMPEGRVLALFGYGDLLQIAQNNGNCSLNMGIYIDHPVLIEFYE
jgi:S-adenosylmethionine hydrolase